MIITQEERNHLNSLPPAFRDSLTSAREATKRSLSEIMLFPKEIL